MKSVNATLAPIVLLECPRGHAPFDRRLRRRAQGVSECPVCAQEEIDQFNKQRERHRRERLSEQADCAAKRLWKANDLVLARRTNPGFVYFIDDSRGAIKIGWAKDPNVRLAQLQTGSPVRLRILGLVPGVKSLERDVHRRFGGLRLHGEWFKQSPLLLEFIERERA